MEACRDNGDWALIDPHSGTTRKTVKARHLFREIVETRHQTGEPFILFGDTANRALPETQKRKGLKIHHSNLCVAGHTPVLTSEGYFPIEELLDQTVSVWNGEEWSETEIKQTAESAKLMTVTLSNGAVIDCTPYHKFYVMDQYHSKPREVRAGDLNLGDKMIKCDFPIINTGDEIWTDAYASGFFCGDGTHYPDTGNQVLWLYGDKRKLISEFTPFATSWSIRPESDRDSVYFGKKRIREKFTVPHGASLATRLEWLAGYMDADGTVAHNGTNESIQIASINEQFLNEVRLLLNTLGCDAKVALAFEERNVLLPDGKGGSAAYDCKKLFRLLINSNDTTTLQMLGLRTRRLVLTKQEPARSAKQFVKVVALSDSGYGPTYCFNEPKRHMGVFNGVLTGNCTEIMLPTNKDRTAVCCLSSLNLAKWDEWNEHPTFISDLMRMLDNCLSEFIEKAPEQLWRAVASAKAERSVGLGAMGWHSFLQDRMIPWGSDLARGYNIMIFEHVKLKVNAASRELAIERGEPEDMLGTGERFAHKMALAPNASSSIFLNISPATEQWAVNIFNHKTLTGSHMVRNPSLENLLEKKGLNTEAVWKDILLHGGSVQHMESLSDVELVVFQTSYETDQRLTVQMACDRAPYIDQGQSINLFVPAEVDADYLLELHYNAWAGGCKSLYYLRSQTSKRAENVNSKVERIQLVMPEEQECQACEG
jgi:ribonucleoside-diphosphate reductase alpha chain